MKKIYDYIDYHEFLKDFYLEHKQENSYFSFRFIGMKLDLDPGFVAKVMQGKMHLALKSIPKFATFCRLTKRETEYFDCMVKFGRAKNERDVKLYFEKLVSMKGVDARVLEKKQYQFYTKWYYTAVRALLGYYRFSGNYAALAKKLSPAITVEQAKDAVKLLSQLGLVRPDAEGIYRLSNAMISTGEAWHSEAIHAFQMETLALARESLDRHPKELRDISTITVSISHKDLMDIRERAKEFRQSILQLKTGNEEQDVVYQINVQVIPLTEIGAE